MEVEGDFLTTGWASYLPRPLLSGSWLPSGLQVGSVEYGWGESKPGVCGSQAALYVGRRAWQSIAEDVIYKEFPLRHWTRDGPERTGCLTQKATEVFKIWICFYAGGHRRITESASHLAACWFLGIPHCEEVHPLPQHHPGGLSLETHSAVSHLYHWALQRKRQGELFPPHSFALRGNVHIYVLNGCFYYCFYLK